MEKRNLWLLGRSFITPAPLGGFFVLGVALIIWMALYLFDPSLLDGYWENLFVEFGGAIFDIIFIAIILAVILAFFERKRDETRQHETIDDYKRWDSEEARFRLAGAIRRLNKMGVYAINLSGIQLTDFSFFKNDIKILSRSKIYNGVTLSDLHSLDKEVKLERVNFDHVDCRSVTFSGCNPFHAIPGIDPPAKFIDCIFKYTDLRNSSFTGALLKWSKQPPDEHYPISDYDQYGEPIYKSITCGPFFQANLKGVSFVEVVFENADFRGAENIREACFFGAVGLDKAIYADNKSANDKIRDDVLKNSKEPPN